jgi:exodeoxyribonuclease V gamma subunit
MDAFGFNVYTSNRLEKLFDHLAHVVAHPLSSPFASEVIIVQSKGMERWLSMQLASRFGAWANCRYPFPNRFVQEMMKTLLGEGGDPGLLDPETVAWCVLQKLPELIGKGPFEPLRTYLGDERRTLKEFQLSERIADLFDSYAVYRPDVVLGWDAGRDTHWQADLWRALYGEREQPHRAALWRRALELLREGRASVSGLAERVSIFGIPALPHYHFELFRAFAAYVPMHLFLLDPCKEYWADILPDRKIVGLQRSREASVGELHFEEGNQVLASLGKLGRDFSRVVAELEQEPLTDFVDAGETTLLGAIQSDILTLRNRGSDGKKLSVSKNDLSFQVHSCHSPWREIEVLHDNLLRLFETDKALKPRDILVMTPDIEAYAPYITAVFEACQDEKKKIPCSIADRRAPSESRTIDLFLKLLALCKGRLYISQVLDLLDAPAVRLRFELSGEDVDSILRWVEETRVRWGIDASHRAKLGLPAFNENSWKAGTERLLLGYALLGDEETLFLDRLPYADVEGAESEALGKFLGFLEELFDCIRDLETPRTLASWSETLLRVTGTFIAEAEESARDIQLLRMYLYDLKELQVRSGFEESVGIEVIRYHLLRRLNREQLSRGFLTGSVTFCEMLPMRSIPFKVIALVGMNSDAFPREERPVGFDIIAQDPRPGDRSLREEDRYLFLEAIVSARHVLYLSYVGQSLRDNSKVPPSVLVSELLDYCEQGFVLPDGSEITGHLLTEHRLQPFSPAYFIRDGALFSYSEEDFAAARTHARSRDHAVPFISKPLPEPSPEWKQVTLRDLKRFYRNPVEYILNNRLGIYLRERAAMLEEEEPFTLDALDKFALGEEMTEKALAGEDVRHIYSLTRARGVLPPGTPGELFFNDLVTEVESFAQHVRPYAAEQILAPLDVEFEIEGLTVSGRIDRVYPAGALSFRFAKDKAKYQLGAWIDHLVLNFVRKNGYPLESRVVTLDQGWVYKPVDGDEEVLRSLLRRYWQGLMEPLRFFPQSSFVYTDRFKKEKDRDAGLRAARFAWSGNEFTPGEGSDPYLDLCFRDMDPFRDPFDELAREVFEPLIAHREKI